MPADYEIWLLHPAQGYPLALVSDFVSLEYVKVTNGVGAFTLTLPATFDMSLVQQDTRVVIYRKPPNGTKQIDFVGFVEYQNKKIENDTQLFILSGYDLNSLLARRIVAYAAGTSQAEKSTYADDMLKAIAEENLGSACADSTRDLSSWGFTIQADASQGTSLSKAFSWRNVLLAMQEIADASHSTEASAVYFGIVPTNLGWTCEFRTNILQWGNDHRFQVGTQGAVLFSVDLGNITQVERSTDWRVENNYCIAGGQGEGTLREIATAFDTERMNQSPFNRREVFADARNESDIQSVYATALTAVREGRPRNIFSGQISNIGQYVYGRDYGHGDYVSASYLGELIHCRIETVNVKVDGQSESVSFNLRSES